ncbi:MAG: anti-sigma regulatory factor [Eubacteriales bacterium]|nr:anti-sigma regulatory factor [Eubacteriales bacterium]
MGKDMQEYTLADAYEVSARDYATAGDASAAIKRKLKQLGVDSAVLRRIAVSSYEAELNMIIHSLGGTLSMTMTPSEIRLLSADIGPGIPDIEQALQEGFSTAGEEARNLGFGAGMGLPNMKRNADEFNIQSEVGKGTQIRMLFHL